ncbi:helix-turn-helix domain-containing protein [Streptomyces drozdowiczii]|uniref:AraC family transcriptional regulator n=1 Tax=Streptomyces drozdowiczii TaxID=202862 RepID=A0ABY6Q177_9ACTN|nr:AraC family transcriptional regulator [Streptomyces drozdowiczii]MCX0242145.1 AraC family transcriptional regulator [Streptomyces drozdowiczii]UZK57769.1 AraC family transcriptional regulator [Streptomyces drozdowiczii]
MDISPIRSTPGNRPADVARLRRVRDLIDRTYAAPLDVVALARGAGMAPGCLGRRFRTVYGQSPYAYLTARRVDRATLLLRGGLGVDAVGAAVGCATPGIFTARFTELVGLPPERFRRLADEAATTGGGAAGAAVAPGVEGLPACLAQRVARAVRNQEAQAPARPLT